MSDLHQEVRDWLQRQADWLQLAADLGITKQWQLDDADISAIAGRLKEPDGQQVTNNRAFENLGAAATPATPIRLQSIGNIQGIENLAPRTPLDFGGGNLCVIYGNNGSGKSGYTRLLKKASGKPGAREIKPNVFKPVPAEQKCRITYHNGAEQLVDWQANSAPVDALRAVDIFDSEVAAAYLSKESESSYTPPLVSLFEKLVVVVGRVKENLQDQQAALVKVLPIIPPELLATKAGAQYNGLKANTAVTEIQKIQTWTNVEDQELTQIVERLNAADPAALARRKRANKTQIERIANSIKLAATAYTTEALESVRGKRLDAQVTRKIAQEAGQVASAKLDGVGTDTWKALWEAARKYSQLAYQQQAFPVVEGDARCVLCHQELTSEAKQRLQDFEAFVQGDLESAAITAETAYNEAVTALPTSPDEATIVQTCEAAGLTDDAAVEGIKTFWRGVAASRTAIQVETELNTAVTVTAPHEIVASLEASVTALEAQATQHDLDAANFNQIEAGKKKLELEAKKWTAQQGAAITAEMQRLKKYAELNEWLRLTNTAPITIKGSQVAEAAISDAYIGRFNSELKKLGATRIQVKLVKTKAAHGKTFHGIQLDNATAKPDDILSEGERRIISLAAFLADASDKPSASTFIFDDPISSLDQDFELAVSARLVQLAKSRQVLVFTHRLSLVVALEDAAGKMGNDWENQHYALKSIETFAGLSGQVALESARNEKPKKANNILLDRLTDAKKKGEQEGSDTYKNLATGLCSEIRVLLEKTVEHDLLGGIVLRNRTSVTTDNKLAGLANIKLEDCNFIDGLMTKYSTLVHSQSTENPVAIPEEPELRKDLEALKTWRDEFSKRPVTGVANV